ncbi:hypothetical protein DICPUDRAFT_33592, partial [Dictyostelium purpureum]
CTTCTKSINGEMIEALGGAFHKDCFQCNVCKNPLTTFFVLDGKPVCKDHYTTGFNCHRCQKSISGAKLTDQGGSNYHPECFKCSYETCGEPLNGAYYIRNENPYCAKCNDILKELAKKENIRELGNCYQCKKTIFSNTPMVVVGPEQRFHKSCLRCTKCRQG